jgi:small subunit ribosomal protein S4
LCRREGDKLFLKGTRCLTQKCAFTKRAYAPGQHGSNKPKLSNYGLQLREKQKVRRVYGVFERQFRNYFAVAAKSKGVTGKILLQLLERRLDNLIYRLGVGASRKHARQIVGHNFVYVNNKRVNIPSYRVSVNDIVELKPKPKALENIKAMMEMTKSRTVPSWLEFNRADLKAKILRLPEKSDIDNVIKEQLIVELYSK